MPAGDMQKLKYAFAFWADAVYVWAPIFSLRARTNGFTMETLKDAVDYAHARGKKIYFTANIYAHNIKIKPFMAQFWKMLEMKPDAFIMADPGLIHLVKKEFPEAVIHLSVQANNTNWAQVQFWETQDIERVILSREISIKEMKEIHEKCPNMELEAFAHGAICMAYSGRCLISNYLSMRDPNQGTCSHSCRWEYKMYKWESDVELDEATGRPVNYEPLADTYYIEEKERPGELMLLDEDENGTYMMNSRDMCGIDYVQDLADAGIISFKVEGRNKTINYVATVAKAYREALDCVAEGKEIPVKRLAEDLFSISNRGYIPGFLAWNPGANAQFYERNGGFQTKVYAWEPIEYDAANKMLKIAVKDRIRLGDTVEILTPTDNKEQKISEIIKTDKQTGEKTDSVEIAHPGWVNVWISCDEDPGEFSVVRIAVESEEDKEKFQKELEQKTA